MRGDANRGIASSQFAEEYAMGRVNNILAYIVEAEGLCLMYGIIRRGGPDSKDHLRTNGRSLGSRCVLTFQIYSTGLPRWGARPRRCRSKKV